jgi:hypothetical protein
MEMRIPRSRLSLVDRIRAIVLSLLGKDYAAVRPN